MDAVFLVMDQWGHPFKPKNIILSITSTNLVDEKITVHPYSQSIEYFKT